MQTPFGFNHQAKHAQPAHQTLSINRPILTAIMILMLFFLAGCSAMNQRASLPPVAQTPSAKIQDGRFVWIDLITQDGNRARAFYAALFGYQVKPVEADKEHQYDLFIRNKRTVAGLVELKWKGLEDNWLPYFKVTDVDRTIASARKLGGKLILHSGKVAVLTDPTGAAFGIQMR